MTTLLTETQGTSALLEPTPTQLDEYERDGYFIARGLFTAEEVAEIRDAFMAQADQNCVPGLFDYAPQATTADPLTRYPRMMQPHRHPELEVGRVALKYLIDRRIEKCLTALLGENPLAAQSMFYFKPAGARGQALHQDNFYLRVFPGTCMAAWTAIDPATEENGGLMVVPGSHKADVACPQQADTAVSFTSEYVAPPPGTEPLPINLAAGDVLFFNGSVIHGSYPNTSENSYRRAFICHYIPESSSEVSHWYSPLIRFDDASGVEIADATGGGPCGTVDAQPIGPH